MHYAQYVQLSVCYCFLLNYWTSSSNDDFQNLNDDPSLTLASFRQVQMCFLMHLNGKDLESWFLDCCWSWLIIQLINLKAPTRLQQTTNLVPSFLIFRKNRHDISCESSADDSHKISSLIKATKIEKFRLLEIIILFLWLKLNSLWIKLAQWPKGCGFRKNQNFRLLPS